MRVERDREKLQLMEPTFIALREYLADGLERPFLNLGDDIREAYLDSPLRFLARRGFGMILGIFYAPQSGHKETSEWISPCLRG